MNDVIRKAALAIGVILLALVFGFEVSAGKAYAAAKKVDCDKVMSELGSGKKAKDVAKDLSISTSSVYRCKKKAAAAAKGTKSASAAGTTSSTAKPASTPSPTKK